MAFACVLNYGAWTGSEREKEGGGGPQGAAVTTDTVKYGSGSWVFGLKTRLNEHNVKL